MSTNVSINDLPVELLEKFASHLNRNTIKSLRCVNKYFNQVFNNDKFWKQYLYFTDKYFLCDLRSDSKLPSLQEVFDEITEREVGKWLGYYKLQKAHVQNWVSGHNQNFDRISLSPDLISYMEETVDKDYQHWLFFGVNNKICAWNITGKPRPVETFSVGSHSKMRLLPHGKLLLRDFYFDKFDGLIAVYQFDNIGFKLNLLYKFVYYMDTTLETSMEPPKRFLFNFRYIVMKDLFIGYDCNITSCKECCLHVWDLRAGVKLGKISLNDCEVMKIFAKFVRSNTENRINITRNSHGCLINLYEGEYPNVILVLKYHHAKISQVSIFNVKSMKFSHLVDQLQSDVQLCSMYSNRVCLEELIVSSKEAVWRVSIYAVNSCRGKLLKYLTGPVTVGHGNNIVFKKSKVFVKTETEVHIISLDTDPIHHIQIEVAASYGILGFFEPKLLLMYDLHQNPTSTTVKVYNALSGVELCSWDRVNTSPDRFAHYFRNLEYPSKLVLGFRGEPELKLFYF